MLPATNPVDYTDEKVKEHKFENKIQEWQDHKEKECQDGDISPSSFSNIPGYIKNYYVPYFEGWDAKEIRLEQLEEFKDNLPVTLSKKTRANIFVSLHAFFTWLFKKGVRDVPPFPTIENIDGKKRIALSYEDQAKYLSMIPERYRDIIEFGMETGLRVGELIVLKPKDVDLKNMRALIRRTVSAYVHVIETTKGKSKKYIPLSNRGAEIAKRKMKGKFPGRLHLH